MLPKISVILPTYNRSNLLVRAIKSVLQQTLAGFELIVVDDGSSDDTIQKVKSIKDSRVMYHQKENGGQAPRVMPGSISRQEIMLHF